MIRTPILILLSFCLLAVVESKAQKLNQVKLPEKFAAEYVFDYTIRSSKQYPQSEEYYLVDRSLMNGVKDYKKLISNKKVEFLGSTPWHLDCYEKGYTPYWIIKDSLVYLAYIADSGASANNRDSISLAAMNKVAKITGLKLIRDRNITIIHISNANIDLGKDGLLLAEWISGDFKLLKVTMWDQQWDSFSGTLDTERMGNGSTYFLTIKKGRIVKCKST